MQVVKSSRTSGITHGIVEGVDGTLSLPYSSLVRIIQHIIIIGPLDLDVLSSGGDSGALWLEAQTLRALEWASR